MELTTLLDKTNHQGPPTQYHLWHLIAAFYFFCQSKAPIGRYKLGSELKLGGGSIRSLIRFLRKLDLIEPIQREGHQLSPNGKRHCKALNHVIIKFVELPRSSYTVDIYNYGCQLRQLAQFVTDGVQQRDAAMQAGASGATTFIQDLNQDTLIMAKDHRIQKSELAIVIDPFNIEVGDVLIIGSGSSKTSAQMGTFAAVLTLIRKK